MKIVKYNQFMILEKYDDNIRKELKKLGVIDKEELERQVELSKMGKLGQYLEENGDTFTFGILKAIFRDAQVAKKKTTIKADVIKIIPRLAPLALIPFYPSMAILGLVFGTSRLFNKIFKLVFDYVDPNTRYVDFLKRMVTAYMRIPEGDIDLKDRFSRAFKVSDGFIDIIKPEIIHEFTNFLCEKMELEDDSNSVPDHYIENELKLYVNDKYDIDPQIETKK